MKRTLENIRHDITGLTRVYDLGQYLSSGEGQVKLVTNNPRDETNMRNQKTMPP